MPTDSDIEDLIEERLDFVRRCLARRMHDSEIISACLDPESKTAIALFRPGKRGKDTLSRGTIRKNYLYVVKQEMRARFAELKGEEELIRSLNSLDQAVRMAFATKNPLAAIAGVRELNHMLGVKVSLIDQDATEPEDLDNLSEAMDDSVGTPDEDD